MKNRIAKSFTMGTLMILFTLTVFSQPVTLYFNSDSVRLSEADKTTVPQNVTDAFAKENPTSNNDTWTSFPANGYTNEWYNDAYSSVATGTPSIQKYYVVEYTNQQVNHKNVYSTDGSKIATHVVMTSDVPDAVSEAIYSGIYKSWDMKDEKKEIFKDKQSDDLKVYKVEVERGNEKHTLFYQADGTLLKDTKV